MAAILIGTTKGILGLDATNTVTGLMLDTIDFTFQSEPHDYYDTFGDIVSVGYDAHAGSVTIKGRLLDGTVVNQTTAKAITVAVIPDYLPVGYTAGTTIVESMNESHAIREYKTLTINARILPKVVSV